MHSQIGRWNRDRIQGDESHEIAKEMDGENRAWRRLTDGAAIHQNGEELQP
jgi:hypothetical protein